MSALPDRPTTDLIGVLISDRYRIRRLIDEGAMGRVFLAEHVNMQKLFAVKLLRHELTQVPSVVARFEREALAAAHIEHPNVVPATDFGKLEDGSVFLVLEYIQGRKLRDEIAHGPLASERALHIALQIASALAAAHALEIVHRDLKPENVMLVEQGADPDFVKVLDFGVAKVPIDVGSSGSSSGEPISATHQISRAGMIFGTPDYMAPEQALGQEVDARADLYALGVVLFEMLAGIRPFESREGLGVLAQQLVEAVPSVADRAPQVSVPESVDRFLAQLLTKEPARRLGSAREALETLERLTSEVSAQPVVRQSDAPTRFLPPKNPLDMPAPKVPPPRKRTLFARAAAAISKPPAPHAAPVSLIARWQQLPRVWRWALPLTTVAFAVGLGWSRQRGGAEPAAVESTKTEAPIADTPTIGSALPELPLASDSQFSEATRAGIPGLTLLSERFPRDPRIAVALSSAHSKEGRHDRALELVEQALKLDPKIEIDQHVTSVIWAAAQAEATRSAAFTILRDQLGSTGAEMAYDMAIDRRLPEALREKARLWMRTAGFARVAAPEVAIAGDLRLARSCSQRAGLLKRSENTGGERTLAVLLGLKDGSACPTGEGAACASCLDQTVLNSAIQAIRARLAKDAERRERTKP